MEFRTIKKGNLRIRGLIFRSYILHILLILVIFWIYFVWAVTMYPPKVDENMSILKEKRTKYGENFYGIKNNRIRKSESGLGKCISKENLLNEVFIWENYRKSLC